MTYVKMNTEFYLLVIGVIFVPPKHALSLNRHSIRAQHDSNFYLDQRSEARDVARRDVGVTQEMSPRVGGSSTRRNYNVQYKYLIESDHTAFVSKKVDNIENDINGFRLKTNVYPYKNLGHEEYKAENNDDERHSVDNDIEGNNFQEIHFENGDTNKKNSYILDRRDSRSQLHRQDSGRHTAHDINGKERSIYVRVPKYTSQYTINNIDDHLQSKSHNNNITPETDAALSISIQDVISGKQIEKQTANRLITRNSLGKVGESNIIEKNGLLNEKKNREEIPWVWSSGNENATEIDLNDRSNFDGSKCATGYVKVVDAGRGRVTTDGLLSALARLRRPPPPRPLQPPALPARSSDGRPQAPKIQQSRPSPEHPAGTEGSMTVARADGSPERLGGALRRLHYRATRRAHAAAARHHSATPKVVVMGSSTTSDKTINTSTDSAATALTSVTGTDDSMDAEPDLIDADPPQPAPEQVPPSTAPPHYHRAQNSCEFDPPAYTLPQSATDTIDSPRPGPARFIFDVPLPEPKKTEKIRNKTQVNQTGLGGPSTSIQIPYDPKTETPKSPKVNQVKYETHFDFEPEAVKRRGSEPRMKNKQKFEKQEYYKDEVAKLRRQLEGTEVFTTHRRRSSAHQHSVPPPCSRRQSTAAQVHVTANPLDSASSMPAGRTTIVVQQPSLSLDYGGCSTILVRDGEDGRRKSRICSDHIQQLLDVTSQFTSEDLHEFDKRYGSPHHSRSQSVKAQRSRTGERQLLGLPQQRARVASMPNTGVEEEYYRLRHFSITGKGVVNRGDSLRSRRSRSNTSVASSASSTEAVTRASAPCSLASSRDSSAGLSTYRVVVLGGPGVGKSSLVGQFMTSEYLHAYDTSIDDESGEKSVCVLLAGEESEITFLDSPPDNVNSDGAAHGYCVVYSTADRTSFAEAERRLQALWAAGHTSRRAVILVGNKADLARSRAVPTDEGKALATSYECKFIETSVGINHNVDELLVGLLTQIRLKQQHAERVRKRSTSHKNRSRARSPLETETVAAPAPASAASTPRKRTRLSASVKVRGLLGRVWARDSKSKSCENLHVL